MILISHLNAFFSAKKKKQKKNQNNNNRLEFFEKKNGIDTVLRQMKYEYRVIRDIIWDKGEIGLPTWH